MDNKGNPMNQHAGDKGYTPGFTPFVKNNSGNMDEGNFGAEYSPIVFPTSGRCVSVGHSRNPIGLDFSGAVLPDCFLQKDRGFSRVFPTSSSCLEMDGTYVFKNTSDSKQNMWRVN